MAKRLTLCITLLAFILITKTCMAQADTSGVIATNVSCFGGHNGSIAYNITGGPGPIKYTWSNGVTGYSTGSCTYAVTLNNPGAALTGFQVQVNVALAAGIDSSFSNVTFIDSVGHPYPFWLTDFPTDSSASFWVRVPNIPQGISTFYLSFCGNDTLSSGNPWATFEFFDNFDSGSVAAYTSNCINIDNTGESCNSALSNNPYFSSPYSLNLSGASSCFIPPYDGAGAIVSRTVTLVNDSLVIDYEDMAAATLYGFCSGGTGTTNTVFVDSINLGNGQAPGQGGTCATNTTTWHPETTLPFAVTTGSATFALQTYGGDCDNSSGWFDDVRIRKYRANPPVVTLNATPQLVLDSLAAGSYIITVVTLNGDTTKATIIITQPAGMQLTADTTSGRCNGVGNGSVAINVSGGAMPYIYAWSNNATTDTISNLANNTYSVTVTDAHNCTATSSATVNLGPLMHVSNATDSASCGLANGDAHLTVTGGTAPYSFVWSPDVSDSSAATGLAPVSYHVTVSDLNLCTVTDTFSIGARVTTLAKPNLGPDTTICPGTDKIILNAVGFVAYQWQDNSTQQTFTVTDSGTYWVVVTDLNGCKTGDTILVTDFCNTRFAVPSAFTPNGDGKNDFFVPKYIDPPLTYKAHVYDRWGDLIFESTNINTGWDGKFKGKDQAPGTYLYYIQYSYPVQPEQKLEGAVELLR